MFSRLLQLQLDLNTRLSRLRPFFTRSAVSTPPPASWKRYTPPHARTHSARRKALKEFYNTRYDTAASSAAAAAVGGVGTDGARPPHLSCSRESIRLGPVAMRRPSQAPWRAPATSQLPAGLPRTELHDPADGCWESSRNRG